MLRRPGSIVARWGCVGRRVDVATRIVRVGMTIPALASRLVARPVRRPAAVCVGDRIISLAVLPLRSLEQVDTRRRQEGKSARRGVPEGAPPKRGCPAVGARCRWVGSPDGRRIPGDGVRGSGCSQLVCGQGSGPVVRGGRDPMSNAHPELPAERRLGMGRAPPEGGSRSALAPPCRDADHRGEQPRFRVRWRRVRGNAWNLIPRATTPSKSASGRVRRQSGQPASSLSS